MSFTLPDLPYTYDSLEPYIDGVTMSIHHQKHHGGYVAKLNKALETRPELESKRLVDLLSQLDGLPIDVVRAVRNNGGGHYNHSIFWRCLSPGTKKNLPSELEADLKRHFGSLQSFKERFKENALGLFGSGWTWLCRDENDTLQVVNTPNQDTPLSNRMVPILGIDVWEHAYYLKYQNRRADYVDAFWNVVNWSQVQKNLVESREHLFAGHRNI